MPKVLVMDPASGSRSTWHEVYGGSEDALNGNISRVFLTHVPMTVPTTDCRQPDAWSCGPYSLAECLGQANGEDARNWLLARGKITPESGTWYDGIVGYLNSKGYVCEYDGCAYDGQMSGAIFDKLIQHLSNGYKAILCMHGVRKGCRTDYWTTGGHYICVYGIESTGDTYTFTLPQIEPGDNGKAVKLLQRLLYTRGLYDKKHGIDGSYGDKTREAVIAYQKHINKHGGNLVVDGVCGPSTWSSILGISGTPIGSDTTFTVKQVKYGDKNVYVLLAQELLKADGYYKGALDWEFGDGTLAAVKKAQTKFKITVDGECGPTTFKKLLKL